MLWYTVFTQNNEASPCTYIHKKTLRIIFKLDFVDENLRAELTQYDTIFYIKDDFLSLNAAFVTSKKANTTNSSDASHQCFI